MKKRTKTLLRAAYIAVLLDHNNQDLFGQGQLHVLEQHMHRSKWPVSTTNKKELVDVVNHWFESNFLTTVKQYIETENQKGLEIFAKFMCHAAGIPRYESRVVRNWLFRELWDKADQQMDNIKNTRKK